MDVSGEWEIWVGVINHGAKIDYTCNECEGNTFEPESIYLYVMIYFLQISIISSLGNTACNLNGVCTDDKQCHCTNKGVSSHRCSIPVPIFGSHLIVFCLSLQYYGMHCGLEVPCPRILGNLYKLLIHSFF